MSKIMLPYNIKVSVAKKIPTDFDWWAGFLLITNFSAVITRKS